jgi:hypothetical protein
MDGEGTTKGVWQDMGTARVTIPTKYNNNKSSLRRAMAGGTLRFSLLEGPRYCVSRYTLDGINCIEESGVGFWDGGSLHCS